MLEISFSFFWRVEQSSFKLDLPLLGQDYKYTYQKLSVNLKIKSQNEKPQVFIRDQRIAIWEEQIQTEPKELSPSTGERLGVSVGKRKED